MLIMQLNYRSFEDDLNNLRVSNTCIAVTMNVVDESTQC